MRALTILPGSSGDGRVEDVPEPGPDQGSVLVEGLALGICGTDREILSGEYGEAPPGSERLVLGHESLGRVVEAPAGGDLSAGDLVVGIVRRPDPVPCPACARREWDFCMNGRYTERGIKALHGYGSERWRIEPEFAVKVAPELGELGVLLEPASVVAKAWEQVERIAARSSPTPRVAMITGAGPIGLLAALMAAQRGLELHVLDLAEDGPKPELSRALGAEYHATPLEELDLHVDVLIECTGAPRVVLNAMERTRPNGIVCLTGVSSGGRSLPVDIGALNRELVLENDVVFGTVNANRRHYEAGARALAAADPGWLRRLITRSVPLGDWRSALERRDDDIKVVLDLQA
jgi:threonine dehydrogenase-like Zn-dependent dehydrogenase